MSKQTIFIIIGAIAIVLVISYLMQDTGTDSQAASIDAGLLNSAEAKSAIAEIKKDGKVINATIHSGVLYAEVLDDDTRRDAYASELCKILRDNNLKDLQVKVVEHNTKHLLESNSPYGIILGEASCK